jgi:hypothetical protein
MNHILIVLFSSPAHAVIGDASLIEGKPSFDDCIENDGSCAQNFYQFLSHSILEQSISMQSNFISASPLSSQSGLFFGGHLSTFPFSSPQENLSGKEENTDFIPVFPKIHFGFHDESYSLGLSFTPPVSVNGASALLVGTRIGRKISEDRSLEAEFAVLKARAPIAATDEQFEEKDSFDNPDNLESERFEERCASQENGCIDTLKMKQISIRSLQIWDPIEAVKPYLQVSLQFTTHQLYIMYDDTTWRVWALQPLIHSGVYISPHPKWLITAGGGLSPQSAFQHRDGQFGVLYTFEGQLSRQF